MKSLTILAVVAIALLIYAPPGARAGLVSWTIDSSQSQLQLAINDMTSWLDVVGTTARIRNPAGSTSSWTAGNLASVGGALLTDYQDGPSPSIQFLPSVAGQTTGLSSGDYRPNLASYTGGTVNPDGSASGGNFNTALAPAVYGGRLRLTLQSIFTVDGGFVSFSDLSYSASSGVVAVDPLTGAFATNQTNFGLIAGLLGIDFVANSIVPEMPDRIELMNTFSNVNTGGIAVISTPDPINQPLLRKMVLPVKATWMMQMEGLQSRASFTGTIVATTIVPEPGANVLLACGAVSLSLLAVSRRRFGR